jgi:molecular chaperone DnaK
MSKIIGIDLGTTNSVVAVLEGDYPIAVPDNDGFRTTPSVVAYTRMGSCLVGRVAKRQSVVNPQNTFYSVKRFMGNTYESVKEEIRQIAYQVSRDDNGCPRMKCPLLGQQLSPENLSAQILKKLVVDAERYLGEKINQAVITVPAYFNDSQRQATRNAGRLAGLEVLRIINEPTAAALAYGLGETKHETIIVFDLGGGTLDVSILEVGDRVFEVLATCGDTHLGGDDFTHKIVNYITTEFYKQEKVNLWQDQQTLQRLIEASEQAKIDLSSLVEASINIPFITVAGSEPKHLDMSLSRQQFNQLSKDLLTRCCASVNEALHLAKLNPANIDRVILVGGSTRMPIIQELLQDLFNRTLDYSVNPDEAIALGAAIQAGLLNGDVKDVFLLDVTPITLGVETLGGIMASIVPRNETIPTKKSETFSTAVDGQTNVEIHILQGENEQAIHNSSLGKFLLDGIPPAPQGVPQIEVMFNIDANGILNVTASDQGSHKQMGITISGLEFNSIESLATESLMTNVKSLELNVSEVPTEKRAEVYQYIENLKTEIERPTTNLGTVRKDVEELAGIAHGTANFVKGVTVLGEAVVGFISFIGSIYTEE